jgi:hypothetical protein
MEFNLKILSRCFLKHYKDYIGEFSHNSQKLSELLRDKNLKEAYLTVKNWLFAIIWAESKSLHNQLISVFSGCVHFATQRRGVESA